MLRTTRSLIASLALAVSLSAWPAATTVRKTSDVQCAAITTTRTDANGKLRQCSRKALKGSKFCWQHDRLAKKEKGS